MFLGRPDGGILCRTGTIREAAEPARDRPSFFAPDFFLRTRTPWLVADLDTDPRLAAADHGIPSVDWREPDPERYAVAFHALQSRIADGTLEKATPVVFATGEHRAAPIDVARALAHRATCARAPAIPFGYWPGGAPNGIVGATPELLFSLDADGTIHTMALAGTSSLAEADGLLDDPKERREHQIVIDSIARTLGAFGHVDVGATEVLRLPHLAHLRTPIRAATNGTSDDRTPDFESIARALHPTPALGGAPCDAAFEWLASDDEGIDRGRFGAPFGVRYPDGSGWCVVAIRAVTWTNATLRIGSGAGIIAESRLDREWDELARKRDAVKRTLGLA